MHNPGKLEGARGLPPPGGHDGPTGCMLKDGRSSNETGRGEDERERKGNAGGLHNARDFLRSIGSPVASPRTAIRARGVSRGGISPRTTAAAKETGGEGRGGEGNASSGNGNEDGR